MKKRAFVILAWGGFLFLFTSGLTIYADYVSIPAAAFKGTTGQSEYSIITTTGHWYLSYPQHYVSKTGSSGRLVAPVYFPSIRPSGLATITQMRVRLFDYTSKGRVLVRLIRVNLETGNWETVYKVNTGKSGKPGSVTKTISAGSGRGVNNAKYAWFIEAEFINPGNSLELGLNSVRIEYK